MSLDPSSAATCARPHARARAPSLAHRTRHAHVPEAWSCAGAFRCRWITRVSDSRILRHAEIQHVNCARAHEIRTRHGGQLVSRRGIHRAFPVGFGPGGAPDAAIRPRAGQQRRSGTAAPTASARERDHGASAPRPSQPAVGDRTDRCEFSAPVPTLFCVASAAARRGSRRGMLKEQLRYN